MGIASKTGSVHYQRRGLDARLLYRWDFREPSTPSGKNPVGWSVSTERAVSLFQFTGSFIKEGLWYRSPKETVDLGTYQGSIKFDTYQPNQMVYISAVVSSERNADIAYIYSVDDKGGAIWTASGEDSCTLSLNIPNPGSHFIRFAYKKDNSLSKGKDMMKVRVINPKRLFMTSGTGIQWSKPVEYMADSNKEERCYLLSSMKVSSGFFELPMSDKYEDGYINQPVEYDKEVIYSPGRFVSWKGKTYLNIKKNDGFQNPDNRDYFIPHKWWTDNPTGVNDYEKYEYVTLRKKVDGLWQSYKPYMVFASLAKSAKKDRIPYLAGDYSPDIPYKCTEESTPIVTYGGIKYVMTKNGIWLGTDKGKTPQQDYAENGNNATWIYFEVAKYLESEIALIHFGLIGASVFWDDYTFSKQGFTYTGVATSQYEYFDPQKLGKVDGLFNPNLLIDWNKGKIIANDAVIRGQITATSGTIGGFNITEDRIESSGEGLFSLALGKGGFRYQRGKDTFEIGPKGLYLGENACIDNFKLRAIRTSKAYALDVVIGLYNAIVADGKPIDATSPDLYIDLRHREFLGFFLFVKKTNTHTGVFSLAADFFREADGRYRNNQFVINDDKSRIFFFDGTHWNEFLCG